MELRGVSPDGSPYKADITDLQEDLRQRGEVAQMGPSPMTIIYKNQITGATRNVDLQEVAQVAGVKNVQFHFDVDKARAQGLYAEHDVDQTLAFSLERLQTKELRQEALKNRGFNLIVEDGDDYYEFKDGKFQNINNKAGLDLSDLTRSIAHPENVALFVIALGALIFLMKVSEFFIPQHSRSGNPKMKSDGGLKPATSDKVESELIEAVGVLKGGGTVDSIIEARVRAGISLVEAQAVAYQASAIIAQGESELRGKRKDRGREGAKDDLVEGTLKLLFALVFSAAAYLVLWIFGVKGTVVAAGAIVVGFVLFLRGLLKFLWHSSRRTR